MTFNGGTYDGPNGIPPDVYQQFETLVFEVMERGFRRYSADALLHRIRWHQQVERGNRDYKCNNNWTPQLARFFMERHPQHSGFFETRKSPHSEDTEQ